MNYLIDTCIVSDFFKKIPSVVDNFMQLSPKQIHISAITVMEIEFGLAQHTEREKKIRPLWEGLLKYTQVIPFSHGCAAKSAQIRSQLKIVGTPIGAYDILIAGTSLANDMIMVTSNFKEFNRVLGITIEDWRTEKQSRI